MPCCTGGALLPIDVGHGSDLIYIQLYDGLVRTWHRRKQTEERKCPELRIVLS